MGQISTESCVVQESLSFLVSHTNETFSCSKASETSMVTSTPLTSWTSVETTAAESTIPAATITTTTESAATTAELTATTTIPYITVTATETETVTTTITVTITATLQETLTTTAAEAATAAAVSTIKTIGINVSITPSPVSEWTSAEPKDLQSQMTMVPGAAPLCICNKIIEPLASDSIITKINKLIQDLIQHPTNISFEEAVAAVDNITSLLNEPQIDSNLALSTLMNASRAFEKFAAEYGATHLNETSPRIYKVSTGIDVLLQKVLNPKQSSDFKFSYRNNINELTIQASVPWQNIDNGSVILAVVFKNFIQALPTGGNIERSIDSHVLSLVLHPNPRSVLNKNVTMTFDHNNKDKMFTGEVQRSCAFWKFATSSPSSSGSWSTDGCTAVSSDNHVTTCSCNHLTNFAILMQVTPKPPISPTDSIVFDLLTYIGLGLSLLGSTLTILAYLLLTDRTCQQTQIRVNLVFSLWAAHLLFLTAIDATRYTVVCVTAAAMLQLFLMAALFWMLLEGIQLYLQLVRVYNADMNLKLCYIFAWGIPVLVVGISLAVVAGSARGIESYTQLKACWISYNYHVAWTFVVPAAFVIVINGSIFFRILKELSNMSQRQQRAQESYSIVRNLKACLVLFPILGITWSIGFVNMLDAGVVTMYLFTILNSTQGLLIFILHCALNLEMRAAFRGKLCRESQVKDFSSSHSHKKTQGQSSIPTPSKTKGVELQLEDVDTGDLPYTNNTY
ncbi:adhesion G protein-coupled receptor L2 isoform X2 [Nematostella vectensis]|uniref:adhesion G protein-coupled receptor L2 isoform X2 n=1 Tax=Nematostella vectensis TaxID=45351 RepID=UPI002076E9D5|nr:adhesion G protein-coupled receptor L2 isoform X2 [Nematostella vectensis]